MKNNLSTIILSLAAVCFLCIVSCKTAEYYEKNGEFEKALEMYKDDENLPKVKELYILLGEEKESKEEFEKASKYYELAGEIKRAADCLVKNNKNLERSIELYKQISLYNEAFGVCKIRAKNSNKIADWIIAGENAELSGSNNEALNIYLEQFKYYNKITKDEFNTLSKRIIGVYEKDSSWDKLGEFAFECIDDEYIIDKDYYLDKALQSLEKVSSKEYEFQKTLLSYLSSMKSKKWDDAIINLEKVVNMIKDKSIDDNLQNVRINLAMHYDISVIGIKDDELFSSTSDLTGKYLELNSEIQNLFKTKFGDIKKLLSSPIIEKKNTIIQKKSSSSSQKINPASILPQIDTNKTLIDDDSAKETIDETKKIIEDNKEVIDKQKEVIIEKKDEIIEKGSDEINKVEDKAKEEINKLDDKKKSEIKESTAKIKEKVETKKENNR